MTRFDYAVMNKDLKCLSVTTIIMPVDRSKKLFSAKKCTLFYLDNTTENAGWN